MKPISIGLIGCGNIAPTYLENGKGFPGFVVEGCADLDMGRAHVLAKQFDVPRVFTVEELLEEPSIELVLILTPPQTHIPLMERAIAAGKHVYTEKPLGLTCADAARVLEGAERKGLMVGCAPDTVLGAGIQTARKLIDDGWLGRPTSATACMQCPGHESWHPDPRFYYQPGGGPLFDMGPYYLSALVTLLGPVRQVAAMGGKALAERVISSEGRRGERIPVEVLSHLAATLTFDQGVIASMIMSFDVIGHSMPHLEIHGTEGSMQVPDPNTFGGPVRLRRWDSDAFLEVPLSHGYGSPSRGLGLAEMADALHAGRAPRASGVFGYHILSIMESLHASAMQGEFVTLSTSCNRPSPMGLGRDSLDSPISGSGT